MGRLSGALWWGARIAGVIAGVVACGRGAVTPSPAAAGAHPAAGHFQNAECVRCHPAVAAEWRASAHAEAFRDPVFQEAYAIEPLPFCVACHAPETRAEAPRAPETELGIACVTCHGRRGGPALACAGCHEFPYPGASPAMAGRLLQKTVTEHRLGNVRASCIDCHMPRVTDRARGHVDHGFAASRDAARVRGAAVVRAERDGGTLVLRFTRASVGHAFPTGDLFRRLRVVVTSGAAAREVVLARQTKRPEEIDTRPFHDGAATSLVRIPLPDERAEASWLVLYERVRHPLEDDGPRAEVDGAIEVARGVLPAR